MRMRNKVSFLLIGIVIFAVLNSDGPTPPPVADSGVRLEDSVGVYDYILAEERSEEGVILAAPNIGESPFQWLKVDCGNDRIFFAIGAAHYDYRVGQRSTS